MFKGGFSSLSVIVAFADTLFQADFSLDTDADGAIWVQRVPDPSAYGVIKLDDNGVVKELHRGLIIGSW